ncbi:metallophosphoesterase [Nocardioides sp.]|uniref:metallophosphoesterase n=1 Tax=Nocardioides sp. TaxID=35761 RepID=UPI003D098DEA
MDRTQLARRSALVVGWLVVSFAVAVPLFLGSQRELVVASHESVVRPTFTGELVVHTGPVLPDVRRSSGSALGVDITLGKTEARTTTELLQRYAFIASQPATQVATVRDAVLDMAVAALLRGALVAAVPFAVWWLLGRRRRSELWARAKGPRLVPVVGVTALATLLVWQPWQVRPPEVEDQGWQSLASFLGPDIPLPAEVDGVEVSASLTTDETKRLIASAVDSYERSKTFYAQAEEDAALLRLRQPEAGETVAILVSDRHDNIGMDPVARAIGDAAGATAVLDAGDDTSTGKSWETFSLDSLNKAFAGYERFSVAGNHDHGGFVSDYLREHGWVTLDGEVVAGPGGSTLLGVNDPRSSGLGTWRDETGLSFAEQADLIADAACAVTERVSTLMVHDAASGQPALERGCVDLVIGGHLHVQVGPTAVVGSNGSVGHSYTNGTTGGAAYAIAVGSKLRREAQVTLITYRDSRPVGLQPVTLQTNGVFTVSRYLALTY